MAGAEIDAFPATGKSRCWIGMPPRLTPHVVYHFSLTVTDKLLGLVILSGSAPAPLPLSFQSSFRRMLQGQETQPSGQFNEMSPAVSVGPNQQRRQPALMFLLCHKYDKAGNDRTYPRDSFHMSIPGNVLLKKKKSDGVWMNILFVTFKFSHLHNRRSQLVTAPGFLRWRCFFV